MIGDTRHKLWSALCTRDQKIGFQCEMGKKNVLRRLHISFLQIKSTPAHFMTASKYVVVHDSVQEK